MGSPLCWRGCHDGRVHDDPEPLRPGRRLRRDRRGREREARQALELVCGDAAAVEAAFAKAHRTTKLNVDSQRLVCNPMEPRACLAAFDAATGRYTLHAPSQGLIGARSHIEQITGLPDPQDGVWFIVSLVVLLSVIGRDDLVAPYDEVRNAEGTVIGCRGLQRVA